MILLKQIVNLFSYSLIIFIGSTVFLTPLFSQQKIEVPVRKSVTTNYTYSRTFQVSEPSNNNIVGIPGDLDTFLLWKCPMSIPLHYLNLVKNNEFSKDRFEELEYDPRFITEKRVNHEIEALTGFRKGKKVIIVDSNNNQDFSDEPVFEYDTVFQSLEERLMSYQLAPLLNIYYDLYYSDKIYSRSILAKVQPFIKFSSPKDKTYEDLAISLKVFQSYRGSFSIENERYNLYIDFFPDYDFASASIYISEYGNSVNSVGRGSIPYRFEQDIILNNNLSISIDSFYFGMNKVMISKKELNKKMDFEGGIEGFRAPEITGVDILSGNMFNLHSQKSKYFVLIFWGTWCGPCKADHPTLKNLYNSIKMEKVEFVGIALDNDVTKVSEYVKKNGMNWKQIYLPISEAFELDGVVANYNVIGYPTYFLIDKDGIVLTRGKLPEIQTQLSKLNLIEN